MTVRTKITWTLLLVLGLVLSAQVFGGDEGQPQRLIPEGAKKANIDLKDRKATSPNLVYASCEKGKEGTWDLAIGGVEHVRFGSNFFVLPLLPNGDSTDYYFVKEKLASGTYYWAFKKTANPEGSFDILYSTDDMTYYFWTQQGIRGNRVSPK
jgi:hypothetical protein